MDFFVIYFRCFVFVARFGEQFMIHDLWVKSENGKQNANTWATIFHLIFFFWIKDKRRMKPQKTQWKGKVSQEPWSREANKCKTKYFITKIGHQKRSMSIANNNNSHNNNKNRSNKNSWPSSKVKKRI